MRLTINEKILIQRRRKGLTNADITRQTGVRQSCISRAQQPWEDSMNITDLDMILTAIDAYVILGKDGIIYEDDILNVINAEYEKSGMSVAGWARYLGEPVSNVVHWLDGIYPRYIGVLRVLDEMGVRLKVGEGKTCLDDLHG